MRVAAFGAILLIGACGLGPVDASTPPPPGERAAAATEPAPAFNGPAYQGKVLEVKHADAFTWLRLKTAREEIWAVVPRTDIAPGRQLRLVQTQVFEHFQSKSLGRTFDRVVFGKLPEQLRPSATASRAGIPPAGGPHGLPAGHPPMAGGAAGAAAAAAVPVEPVAKASGDNAQTVAEVLQGAATLREKTVRVQARVVRYNADILGRNWLHLRDGSGGAAQAGQELVVTTREAARTGEVLTVTGVVRTERDFGAGYKYPVLLEDAALQR